MARRQRRGGEKRDSESNLLELEGSLCKVRYVRGYSEFSFSLHTRLFRFSNIRRFCFSTSRNKHYLSQAWGILYDTGERSDISFLIGPSETLIRAHKIVLSTHSKHFAALFFSGMEESTQSVIKLPNQDAAVFETLIRFMYTGQIRLNKDTVQDLIRMADYYAIESVKESVGDWIGKCLVDMTNVVKFIIFANTHNVQTLYKYCHRFMLGNAKDIFFSKCFQESIPNEILERMVASDDLNLTELELFESLVQLGRVRTGEGSESGSVVTSEYSESSDEEHVMGRRRRQCSASLK
eukprot:sb/3467526/